MAALAGKKAHGTRRRKRRLIHCHQNGEVRFGASCGARGEHRRQLHLGRLNGVQNLIRTSNRRRRARCYELGNHVVGSQRIGRWHICREIFGNLQLKYAPWEKSARDLSGMLIALVLRECGWISVTILGGHIIYVVPIATVNCQAATSTSGSRVVRRCRVHDERALGS